jgi:hypothetical protein
MSVWYAIARSRRHCRLALAGGGTRHPGKTHPDERRTSAGGSLLPSQEQSFRSATLGFDDFHSKSFRSAAGLAGHFFADQSRASALLRRAGYFFAGAKK